MAGTADRSTVITATTEEDAASGLLGAAEEEEVLEDGQVSADADAGEAGEREQEAGETAKQEGESEDQGEVEPEFRVIKDSKGNEYEVPVELAEEYEKGALRQQDYTRKTQQTAAERKELDAAKAEVFREREEAAQVLVKLRQTLEASMPQEPDWDQIARDKPDEFARIHAAWRVHVDRLDKVTKAEDQAQQQVLADRQSRLAEHTKTEIQRLSETFPEMRDPAKKGALIQRWERAAVSLGYEPEDLAKVRDHRLFVLLDKAAELDALKAGIRKAKPGAPAAPLVKKPVRVTLKPGASLGARPKTTAVTKAREQLAKTGRVEDAAAAFIASGILD